MASSPKDPLLDLPSQTSETPFTTVNSTVNSSFYNEETSFDTAFEQQISDLDIEETETGWYIWVIVACSCIGGLMFGYDTACISSILYFLEINQYFDLSSSEKELITSITSVGSLIGSLFSFKLADKYGRKFILTSACVIFTISSIQLSLSYQKWHLYIGRFIVGLGVGSASMCVPVYISEIAPSKIRGKLLALNSISTTGGQFFANILAISIKSSIINWRLMFLISGIPSLLFLILVKLIPESPRFLILNSDYDKATKILSKIYSNSNISQIQMKLDEIINDINSNKNQFNEDNSILDILFTSPATIRALSIGCLLMFFQQATGFNSLMYYGSLIFNDIGVGNPLIVSILISGTNFLFTFVALIYIDKIGRRKMLLNTVWIMSLSLFISGIFFSRTNSSTSSMILISSILIFVASYASGMGTIPWSSVEFLPLEARATGSAIISSIGWLSNFLVSSTYLSLTHSLLGVNGTSIIFSIICMIGWLGIYGYYPEVSGLSLEEIRNVFKNGIIIHYKHNINS